MSMDAVARLWYGVHGELPAAVTEEMYEEGEIESNGVAISLVWCYDRLLGVGGTIARSYWDDRTPIDPGRIDTVRAEVDKYLDDRGVAGDRAVFLTAAYQ